MQTAARRGSAFGKTRWRNGVHRGSTCITLVRKAGGAPELGRFRATLQRLAARDPQAHAQRLEELAYLANVLVAGCPYAGRRLRPIEAVRIVAEACERGFQLALERERAARAAEPDADARILSKLGAVRVFRIGYHLLA